MWNLSRFSRSLVDALKAIDRIEAAGGAIYSASGEAGDGTPTGRLTRNIFPALAQMERERARDGFAAAQSSAIGRGIFTASPIPTGYVRNPDTRKLEVDPAMAPVIATLFEKRIDGESWTNLAKWFIENGGSPKADRTGIKWIISNPTYLGWSRSGEFVNKKAHVPIVSQLLFDKANAVKGKKPRHDGSRVGMKFVTQRELKATAMSPPPVARYRAVTAPVAGSIRPRGGHHDRPSTKGVSGSRFRSAGGASRRPGNRKIFRVSYCANSHIVVR